MTDVKLALAKQVNVAREYAKVLRVAGTLTSYQVTTQNGTISNSQLLFSNVALPSLSNSVISKNMRVRYQVVVSATADPPVFNPTVALGAPPTLVLRQFPLSACTDTLTAQINNVSSTINLRQIISGYSRMIDMKYLKSKASEAPSQCDDNAVLSADTLQAVDGVPTSNQVFSTYYNGSHWNRGCFEPIAYDGTAHSFTYEIVEPVMVSPFSLDDTATFFANINTLSIQYNMSGLTDMLLVANQGALPAGLSVTLGSQAFLEFEVISLDNRVVSIPRVYMTDYCFPQYFLKSFGSVTTDVTSSFSQVNSDTLRLASMPEHIIIYANCPPTARGGRIADSFLQWGVAGGADGANALSITLNNRQGLLQASSVKELWRISVRNGYPYSFTTWKKCGGPIIISPALDLGLSPENSDIYAGMAGNVILQVSASLNSSNFTEASVQQGSTALTFAPQLVVVCMMKGVAEISPDSMALNLGYLSVAEVNAVLSDAPSKGESIPDHVIDAYEVAGGALFGQKKALLGSVAHGAMKEHGGSVLSGAGLRKHRM